MNFLNPKEFEPVKLSDLAATNELVAIRKDAVERLMDVGNTRKEAVEVTLLVVTGQRAGTVEPNKAIGNTALRRILNDARVSLGDVFIGRLITKTTDSGTEAVILDGCSEADRQFAESMWTENVAAQTDTDEPDVDVDEPPDEAARDYNPAVEDPWAASPSASA